MSQHLDTNYDMRRRPPFHERTGMLKHLMTVLALLTIGCGSSLLALDPGYTTLTVSATDTDGPNALTYTWSIDTAPPSATATFGTNNGSATGNSCTVTVSIPGDYKFTVRVFDGTNSVTDTTGTVHWTKAPSCSSVPTTSGQNRVGQLLTAAAGVWSNPDGTGTGAATITYAWSWLRAESGAGLNAAPISGANAATYTLTQADYGKYIRAVQTATSSYAIVTPVTASSSYTAAILAKVGDLNTNGLVNFDDLSLFLAAYGSAVGLPAYNAAANIVNTGASVGKVDFDDLSAFLAVYTP